jgi:phosphonate transport system substrate-binding protein
MKNSIFKKLLIAQGVAVAGMSLASCGTVNADDSVIRIQFVPSRDAGQLATLASKLCPILEKYEPNYKFEINTGTSYAATTEALKSEQIDVGFLTASGYAEATLKNPGKVEVLLTSVRKNYKVLEDFNTEEEQIKGMNWENTLDGKPYEYRGDQSQNDTNNYKAVLVVKSEYYKDSNNDGKIDVKDLVGIDKPIAIQGATSGAGNLRPRAYLADKGLSFSETKSSKNNEIWATQVAGYDQALSNTLSGSVAGFWGFLDVRYSNAYAKEGHKFYKNDLLFSQETKTMAITDGIYNDTISVRSSLSDEKKNAIKNAFLKAVKDGSLEDKESGASILYNVYSHTGYLEAKDSDFDGERKFYTYCVEHNLI